MITFKAVLSVRKHWPDCVYQNIKSLCWFCRNVFQLYRETFNSKGMHVVPYQAVRYLHTCILTYYFMQFIDSIWYLVKPNHVWKCKVEVECFWHPCLDILFMGVQWNEMNWRKMGRNSSWKSIFTFFSDLPFHKSVLPILYFSYFWSSVLWCSLKFFTTATKTS